MKTLAQIADELLKYTSHAQDHEAPPVANHLNSIAIISALRAAEQRGIERAAELMDRRFKESCNQACYIAAIEIRYLAQGGE